MININKTEIVPKRENGLNHAQGINGGQNPTTENKRRYE